LRTHRSNFTAHELRRLLDAEQHLRALEQSAAGFGGDFDLAEFESAWRSGAPEELNRANAVQAGYENVINACIKIAQELCELEGWTAPNREPTSIEALAQLRQHGVIGLKTHSALKETYERRGDMQHDYAGVAARELHDAAKLVLAHASLLLQDVAAQIRLQGS
jgi:predicted TIM-barrel fold metal-dependent hydrolase